MWLVLTAMRRPITILVAVISIALCSILALRRMAIDVSGFPERAELASSGAPRGVRGRDSGDSGWNPPQGAVHVYYGSDPGVQNGNPG